MSKSSKLFFSIVIPTLNEEKFLPHLLADLSAQTFRDFEVVHIDAKSEDKTVAEAKKFVGKIDITSKKVAKRNVSFQRNAGAQLARGEWLIFMDADNRLDKDYLKKLAAELKKNPEIDVFANWLAPEKNAPLHQGIVRAANLGLELYKNIGRPMAFGALIGARREAARKILFDQSQQIFEDGKFMQRAVEMGFTYALIRNPRFVFSLRRFRKEGTVRMLGKAANMHLKYLQRKSFEDNNYGYPMEGGGYYEIQDVGILDSLHNYLKSASRKQLQQAKKIMNSLQSLKEL